jgi:ABC-type multidrug transport system ATPase subunit
MARDVRTLSPGNLKKLGVLIALINSEDILFLGECFRNGLVLVL